ncbi:MAG TPA: cell division protein SepF [Clostridia bacterium]|nr:cell division protein SepF [Clostridia bacterium]
MGSIGISGRKAKPSGKEIDVVCPEKFSEIEELVARLRRRESVIVDLEEIPPAIARRMLDFISGGVFALEGTVRKIKRKTYILIPQGVKVSSVRRD